MYNYAIYNVYVYIYIYSVYIYIVYIYIYTYIHMHIYNPLLHRDQLSRSPERLAPRCWSRSTSAGRARRAPRTCHYYCYFYYCC